MINLILSMTNDYGIGRDGKLCTTSSEDFARFRNLTLNHTVVMGRLTAESLPKGPLPNRDNVVLSSSGNYRWLPDGTKKPVPDFDLTTLPGNVFIIGGKSLYEEYLHLASKVYLTQFNVFCPSPDTIRLNPSFLNYIHSNFRVTDRSLTSDAIFTDYSRNL
jgi:dihydrofolate reductase